MQNLRSHRPIKFTEAGGSIVLPTRKNDQTVVIKVEVNPGVGIGKAFMPNLFNTFKQDDAASPQGGNATELGLAMTKRLVDLLNGMIEVESTKGEGPYFTVRLPRIPSSAS